MDKNKLSFFTLFLIFPLSVFAQWSINIENHFPKDGDKYSKSQVEFLEPDEKGKDISWDFSNTTKTGKDITVRFKLINDSILIKFEDKSQTTYHKQGNSLFLKRLENPFCIINDSIPCEIVKLPLPYGKSSNSPYIFHGIYCDQNRIESKGDFHIYADACGTLILPDDTIKNVIRVHAETNAIETVGNSKDKVPTDTVAKSIQHKTDKYYWYSDMYRYPLVESIRHSYFLDDKEISKHEISYIFTPLMQEQDVESSDDENNYNLSNNTNNGSAKEGNSNEIMTGKISDLTVDFDNQNISVNYSIAEGKTELEITLFDIDGRVFAHVAKHIVENGYYSNTINCNSLPTGNYILNITTTNSISNRFIPVR